MTILYTCKLYNILSNYISINKKRFVITKCKKKKKKKPHTHSSMTKFSIVMASLPPIPSIYPNYLGPL